MGFPDSSVGKESAYNAGDPGSIPGSGRIRWRRERLPTPVFLGFPCGSASKESTCNVGDLGSTPVFHLSLSSHFPVVPGNHPLSPSCHLQNGV